MTGSVGTVGSQAVYRAITCLRKYHLVMVDRQYAPTLKVLATWGSAVPKGTFAKAAKKLVRRKIDEVREIQRRSLSVGVHCGSGECDLGLLEVSPHCLRG